MELTSLPHSQTAAEEGPNAIRIRLGNKLTLTLFPAWRGDASQDLVCCVEWQGEDGFRHEGGIRFGGATIEEAMRVDWTQYQVRLALVAESYWNPGRPDLPSKAPRYDGPLPSLEREPDEPRLG